MCVFGLDRMNSLSFLYDFAQEGLAPVNKGAQRCYWFVKRVFVKGDEPVTMVLLGPCRNQPAPRIQAGKIR
ncbi:MAG: hypothetical protein CMF17_11695 [Idiomarinaceae bacterium]|nr:hypothetical protein [Idiomarinaceae bacterium]